MDEKIKVNEQESIQELLRSIPSVEKLAQSLEQYDLPQSIINSIIRAELNEIRSHIVASKKKPKFDISKAVQKALKNFSRSRIQKVINGTGVILHTNLGRAPLDPKAAEHVAKIATSYNNLEFDITKGKRGIRGVYAEQLLNQICGSEATSIVNNCAAALVIILKELISSDRKEVIISRGELVQIGGGFRIPDILESSGAKLKEVGTTNKTTLTDYEDSINSHTALILKVHQSNFYMEGFVESPPRCDLSKLAKSYSIPLVEDLGSGAIIPTSDWEGTPLEPTPETVIQSGVDLVCFSGDKLFGGPQAGIIAGREDLVKRIKSNPFYRCLRCDKLILSGLEYTAESYLNKSFEENVFIHSVGNQTLDQLRERAENIVGNLKSAKLTFAAVSTMSTVGGGTLPKARIPSAGIELTHKLMSATKLQLELLHKPATPIASKIEDEKLLIDLRTIPECEDHYLYEILSGLEGKIST